MSNAKQLIKQYLTDGKLMQLATSKDNIPWICSVYYVVDDKQNIYWLSYPERRHSLDIAANHDVAVTVAVKQDVPVIGVQAQGVASKVKSPTTVARVMYLYVKKYGVGKSFYKNFTLKTNKHVLYRFTPSKFVLFDEENFGMNNPQEIIV